MTELYTPVTPNGRKVSIATSEVRELVARLHRLGAELFRLLETKT